MHSIDYYMEIVFIGWTKLKKLSFFIKRMFQGGNTNDYKSQSFRDKFTSRVEVSTMGS